MFAKVTDFTGNSLKMSFYGRHFGRVNFCPQGRHVLSFLGKMSTNINQRRLELKMRICSVLLQEPEPSSFSEIQKAQDSPGITTSIASKSFALIMSCQNFVEEAPPHSDQLLIINSHCKDVSVRYSWWVLLGRGCKWVLLVSPDNTYPLNWRGLTDQNLCFQCSSATPPLRGRMFTRRTKKIVPVHRCPSGGGSERLPS